MKFGTGLILILFLSISAVFGQTAAGQLSAGNQSDADSLDNYLIKIAVISPGSEIYMWWGHIALVVQDTRLGTTKLYNWGTFTYPGKSFIMDFINGRVRYMVSSGYIDVNELAAQGWEITAYTLDLDRKGKEQALAYAEYSVQPENCYYNYDEFRDNCSTRIRDLINFGTEGQFGAFFSGFPTPVTTHLSDPLPAPLTIRQQIRRFTWSRPFSDWYLNLLMGQNFDRKMTSWEAMFLPAEVARNINDFSYTDDSGNERKLVSNVEVIGASKNSRSIPDTPPAAWPFAAITGLAGAVLIFLFIIIRKRYHSLGRILLGLSQSLFGLLLGISGCIVLLGLVLVKNEFTSHNVNLLLLNPLLLLAVPLGIFTAMGHGKGVPRHMRGKKSWIYPDLYLRVLWIYVLVAGCITMLLQMTHSTSQQNQAALCLILPIAFVCAFTGIKINGLKFAPFWKNDPNV